MKKTLGIFSSSRADTASILPIIKENKFFKIKLIICGTHLEKKFGKTAYLFSKLKSLEIIKYKTTDKNLDTKGVLNTSINTLRLANKLASYKLDGLIVVGDRFEALMFTYAAFIQDIKIFHLGGGEMTLGSYDEKFRHCISLFSTLHFVTRPQYKKKLKTLGVKNDKIIFSGDTSQEYLLKEKKYKTSEITQKFNISLNKKNILLCYHPVTNNLKNSIFEFKNIINCLEKLNSKKYNIFITSPNSDKGSYKIINIKKKKSKLKNFFYIENIGKYYFSFLRNCIFLIGNSSSGITDTILLGVKTINIGQRQEGRIMPKNVINANSSEKSIYKAIKGIINKNEKIKIKRPISAQPEASKTILKNIKKFLKNENS